MSITSKPKGHATIDAFLAIEAPVTYRIHDDDGKSSRQVDEVKTNSDNTLDPRRLVLFEKHGQSVSKPGAE